MSLDKLYEKALAASSKPARGRTRLYQHPGIVLAQRVTDALKRLPPLKGAIDQLSWSNGREQGYRLRHSGPNVQLNAAVSNDAHGDEINVYLYDLADTDTGYPHPRWPKPKKFSRGSVTKAARAIHDYFSSAGRIR